MGYACVETAVKTLLFCLAKAEGATGRVSPQDGDHAASRYCWSVISSLKPRLEGDDSSHHE